MLQLLDSLAVSFDLPILDWIQANMQSGFLDTIMPIITLFGDAGIFWMACATILLFTRKHRRTGLGVWFALTGSAGVQYHPETRCWPYAPL